MKNAEAPNPATLRTALASSTSMLSQSAGTVLSPSRIYPMAAASRTLQMVQIDVFTERALTGNALAVCLDGRALTTEQMQAVARETNLSETTFILPGDAESERQNAVRVRIFTVQEELPFAGHPTLGTAFVLRGASSDPEIKLALNAGLIPVRFEDTAGQPALGEMTQVDPQFVTRHDRDAVAKATGLSVEDLDPELPIETVSTGLPFTVTPVRSLAVLRDLRIDPIRTGQYLAQSGGKFFYFVCRETVDPTARLHARMLFYGGEDPATGSAAGCTAAWMVAHGVAQPDERVLIEQGIEMKRPSRIFVRASRTDNRVVNVRVGGNAVEIMRCELVF
jgi:trans-2,3-dihydro-3-hydroxyanthranilate isomerase